MLIYKIQFSKLFRITDNLKNYYTVKKKNLYSPLKYRDQQSGFYVTISMQK